MNRIFGVAFIVLLMGVVLNCNDSGKKHNVLVVNFVEHPVLNKIENSFKDRLKELLEKDEYGIVSMTAQGRVENLASISRQAIRQKPDVIVTISTPVTQAMMREIDDRQKIVYTFVTNPEDLGDELTTTNSTGLSDAVNYADNIRLIKKIYGEDVVIGMVYNPNEANSVYGINVVERLLSKSETELITATADKETQVPEVVRQLANAVDVIYVGGDNTIVGAINAVLLAAKERGTPVFASDSGSIEAGAVAGISVDYEKLGALTADVVISVLKGGEPNAIPRRTIKGDDLIINEKALKDFALTEEQAILLKEGLK